MDQDEREALRQEMLQDQLHEYNMRNDIEYFCEYTLNNFAVYTHGKQYLWLPQIFSNINKECKHFDQDINDLFKYINESL